MRTREQGKARERERERSPKTPFEEGERGTEDYEGREDERTTVESRRRGGTRNGFENTYAAAVVEAGRSWPALIRHLMLEGGVPGAPRAAGRLSLLVAPVVQPPCRAYVYLSLFPVIARDPTPQPPPAEGSLLFLRSAIRQIAIDTDDPLFLFLFSFSSPSPFPSPSSGSLESPLSFVPSPALFSLLNLRQRQKAVFQFFHLGSRDKAHSILPRAFFIYLVLFSESPVSARTRSPPSLDRAADNADRYRRVRTCGDFRGFAAGRYAG